MIVLSNPLFAILGVFLAGLLASLAPCTVVTIPLVIGFVGGYSEGDPKRSLLYSLFFSLGLAMTFTALGLIASLTGTLLGDIGWIWKYILSFAALAIGLSMLGVFPAFLPAISFTTQKKGLLGAFVMGLLFGVASSPCTTPVLGFVLAYVASKHNLIYGAMLLMVYSIGNTAIIFLLGVSTGLAQSLIRSRGFQNLSALSYKLGGAVFILVGILILLYMR